MDTMTQALTQISETIALIDCGQASKVTKGTFWGLFYEFAQPPFDRLFVF
jgi:hypothetical protein